MRTLLATFLLAGSLIAAEMPSQPLNIVLICIDDLKPTLGCYGDPVARTPHIDRLASQGTVFSSSYVHFALCAPSRNSLLTGLRPDQIGVYDLGTFFRVGAPDAVTIGQTLKSAGWWCEATGKILHLAQGNQDDAASWSTETITFGDRTPIDVTGSPQLPPGTTSGAKGRNGKPPEPVWSWPDVPDSVTKDAQIAEHAAKRITALAAENRSFFFAVGFSKPHLPFRIPKRWWDMYDPAKLPLPPSSALPEGTPKYAGHDNSELRSYDLMPASPATLTEEQTRKMLQGYYACTSFVDDQVGKVMQALDQSGIRNRTIVVLWGDHGWHLGDHGLWGKYTNLEQATRNPLIISAPGMPTGQKSPSLAATIDIYPTLCELVGVKPSVSLPGVSLVPVLRDPQAKVQDHVIHVLPRPQAGGNGLSRALRTATMRYVETKVFGDSPKLIGEELYDYTTDPDESRNLAKDPNYATALAELRRTMESIPAPKPPVRPLGKGGNAD